MEQIKICKSCNGLGSLAKGIDYHPRSGYDSWEKIECTDCKGTGRVVRKKTVTITVRPFDIKKDTNVNKLKED